MRVFSYIRVSSKGQLDDGGPDRQREAIVQFCAAHGLEHVAEYLEPISGTKDIFDRPIMERMLALVEECDVKAIVVERLDRLARDLLTQELIIKNLSERELRVFDASSMGLIDVAHNDADPGRLAMRQMMGVFAQYEKSMLSRRMRLGKEKRARERGWGLGPMPFGFLDEEEKTTLAYLESLASQTPRLSYAKLAHILNTSAAKPFKTRNGKLWTAQTVFSILKTVNRRKERKL